MIRRAAPVAMAFLLPLLLVGCAHVPMEKGCTALGKVGYCLQPSALRFSAAQLVETSSATDVGRLIVYIEVKDGDITMVGLTPFGRRVMQIRFDANGVASDLAHTAPVSAAHLLAGLQLAAWPLEQARAGVRGATARLVQNADGSRRELRDGDTVVFSATCDGERPLCRTSDLRYEALGQSMHIEVLEDKR